MTWYCKFTYLLGLNWLLRSLVEFFDDSGIIAKILFAANENDGEARAKVEDLRNPLLNHVSHYQPISSQRKASYLLLNVVERIGGVYSKADQYDVRVWV